MKQLQYTAAAFALIKKRSRGTRKPVSATYVMDQLDLSRSYVNNLIAPLVHNGILRSVRGVNGGYVVNQAPVTALDIRKAMSGPLLPEMEHNQKVWAKVEQAIDEELGKHRL